MTSVIPFPSDNVVPFPEPVTRQWVCACGCVTFEAIEQTGLVCAACGERAAEADSGWLASNCTFEGAYTFCEIRGVEADDTFARRRMTRLAGDADVIGIVLIREGGGVTTWAVDGVGDNLPWLRRRLADAMRIFRGWL